MIIVCPIWLLNCYNGQLNVTYVSIIIIFAEAKSEIDEHTIKDLLNSVHSCIPENILNDILNSQNLICNVDDTG